MEGLSSISFLLLLRFPFFLGRLGDLGLNVGIHPFFGMYVGFFAGICGFVVSRGLITPGCFGRGVLGGFR